MMLNSRYQGAGAEALSPCRPSSAFAWSLLSPSVLEWFGTYRLRILLFLKAPSSRAPLASSQQKEAEHKTGISNRAASAATLGCERFPSIKLAQASAQGSRSMPVGGSPRREQRRLPRSGPTMAHLREAAQSVIFAGID